MGNNFDQSIVQIMSGRRKGVVASFTRLALSCAEIPYRTVIRARNALYDRGWLKSRRLARPVISVGNITAGGTGKTPVVAWLANHFRNSHPAILLRGYKGSEQGSDEQILLSEQLKNIPVIARPDRVRGAAVALAQQSSTGLFILDDGMQHRKIGRDFELVLIDATNPFGFDHVLPRGLQREPLNGLARASAFLITRNNLVPETETQRIAEKLQQFNPRAPIFRAAHVIAGLSPSPGMPGEGRGEGSDGMEVNSRLERGPHPNPLPEYREREQHPSADRRLFLFCAIGNPQSLQTQLTSMGLNITGSKFFPDHHPYTLANLDSLATENADAYITTEKDWTKIRRFNHPILPRIWRTELSLSFSQQDEQQLLNLIRLSIAPPAR